MAGHTHVGEAHPLGEGQRDSLTSREGPQAVDTFGGRVSVDWDPDASVTAYGPVTYFIEFLKVNGLWEEWVRDCPLQYSSPNAPPKADILGTVLLAVLAGHKRYAHITTIRGDRVLPELLGMQRVRSEDAVRRAFQHGDEQQYEAWMSKHLLASYEPLLQEPWILDMDATVKPLYGHQEQAERGYNPGKPGRPSHVYHCYFLAAIRMVLEVEVQAGNHTASQYAQPGLWAWLDARPREQWPRLLRGDLSWGTERMMREAEERGLPYLFQLKKTAKVSRHIVKQLGRQDWSEAGAGWQGIRSELQLTLPKLEPEALSDLVCQFFTQSSRHPAPKSQPVLHHSQCEASCNCDACFFFPLRLRPEWQSDHHARGCSAYRWDGPSTC
jgi:hypothetical protein